MLWWPENFRHNCKCATITAEQILLCTLHNGWIFAVGAWGLTPSHASWGWWELSELPAPGAHAVNWHFLTISCLCENTQNWFRLVQVSMQALCHCVQCLLPYWSRFCVCHCEWNKANMAWKWNSLIVIQWLDRAEQWPFGILSFWKCQSMGSQIMLCQSKKWWVLHKWTVEIDTDI